MSPLLSAAGSDIRSFGRGQGIEFRILGYGMSCVVWVCSVSTAFVPKKKKKFYHWSVGSKQNLFFTVQSLFFSEPRGCPGVGWHLPWFRPWLNPNWEICLSRMGPNSTRSDFLESQTDSNSTRTIWNPRWPEMIWDQTTRSLTRSKPKQLETRDDPKSDNLKPNPIRNWTTQKPRQPRIRRPNTRPNPNPNDPKLEMTQDQTIWNQPDPILKDLNMIKL
jgi:hypothetical protein